MMCLVCHRTDIRWEVVNFGNNLHIILCEECSELLDGLHITLSEGRFYFWDDEGNLIFRTIEYKPPPKESIY